MVYPKHVLPIRCLQQHVFLFQTVSGSTGVAVRRRCFFPVEQVLFLDLGYCWLDVYWISEIVGLMWCFFLFYVCFARLIKVLTRLLL